MPKGEYHTPGPFHLTSPSFIHRQGVAHPVLITAAQFDEAEKDELVGLLNKGTHHERLVAALIEIERLSGPTSIQRARKIAREALAPTVEKTDAQT